MFDRHSENVGGALQERDVVFAEFSLGPAVDLEHAEGLAIALQDHIHRAADAVLDQEFRRPEALLVFEMIGNHRLAGMQGKACRRCEIGADAGRPDNAFVPANTGPHQQPVLSRHIFQNLAVFRLQPFRREAHGLIEQVGEGRTLERQHAQIGQNLLLANTQPQRSFGQAERIAVIGSPFDDRLVFGGGRGHVTPDTACRLR